MLGPSWSLVSDLTWLWMYTLRRRSTRYPNEQIAHPSGVIPGLLSQVPITGKGIWEADCFPRTFRWCVMMCNTQIGKHGIDSPGWRWNSGNKRIVSVNIRLTLVSTWQDKDSKLSKTYCQLYILSVPILLTVVYLYFYCGATLKHIWHFIFLHPKAILVLRLAPHFTWSGCSYFCKLLSSLHSSYAFQEEL